MVDIHIDIGSEMSVLVELRDIISKWDGWTIHINTTPGNYYWKDYKNNCARYFKFDLETFQFRWTFLNSSPPEDTLKVYTIGDALELLEWIQEKSQLFRNLPSVIANPERIKQVIEIPCLTSPDEYPIVKHPPLMSESLKKLLTETVYPVLPNASTPIALTAFGNKVKKYSEKYSNNDSSMYIIWKKDPLSIIKDDYL